MSVIDEVRLEREELARVLKKHLGIRRIVEDLYPDSAHFIYELLQNAEDQNATQVRFLLSDDKLRFEHNGDTFRPDDIYAITEIGEGTKARDDDKIGRFGIGFKAVFAYSETPRIWSPTYSFEISELVLPSELPTPSDLEGRTRFEFPFNNPKKTPADAHNEIHESLNELAETTLLFLQHIESIEWKIEHARSGEIVRVSHGDWHVEMLKKIGDNTPSSLHFLKFEQPVHALPKQNVAVAFPLDYLPGHSSIDASNTLNEQLKIVPAAPGQVAIFFPAPKESSGLRFHVHAPFVPELSRASIKETEANGPLFQQIAELVSQALHLIRDLGLLNTDFLGVLPNPQDQLGYPYECIRNSVVNALNEERLTPTYLKSHEPARILRQAKAALKNLLSEDDLTVLITHKGEPSPLWAASRALQGTNAERLMNSLAIRDWDVDDFVKKIAHECARWSWGTVDSTFREWFSSKPLDWHQQFYALLQRESEVRRANPMLAHARIVRLTNGDYESGHSCHFAEELSGATAQIPVVDPAVYTSGRNKVQQQEAKDLLIWAGVTEIGMRQIVQSILNENYRVPQSLNKKKHISHIRQFIKLHDNDPSCAQLFASYPFFRGEDDQWHHPKDIFLDVPYLKTGLKAYYRAIGVQRMSSVSGLYKEVGINTSALIRFAEATGVRLFIEPKEVSCRNNPSWDWLQSAPGERKTSPYDRDFVFPHFRSMVEEHSVDIAGLIWRSMWAISSRDGRASAAPLTALYRKTQKGGAHQAPSQLVHQLRNSAWIPQKDQFVKPADARAEDLPEGFVFESGAAWLAEIKFGETFATQATRLHAEKSRAAAEKERKESAARELGFEDLEVAEQMSQLLQESPELVENMWQEFKRGQKADLPVREHRNPNRRDARVFADALEAVDRHNENRIRSVSLGVGPIKEEAEQYLKEQYTNSDGELICQLCKSTMPFRLSSGEYYFEKVQFLPELQKLHRQNFLALCPNHSAMFQYANDSESVIQNKLAGLEGNELPIALAGQEAAVYFTRTHIADLRTILRAEKQLRAATDQGPNDR